MKINEQWETLKEESHVNIQSEKDILNRQIRSIQTEGYFGDIKEKSINTIVFFMMRLKNLKEKQRKKIRISHRISGIKNADFYGRFLF